MTIPDDGLRAILKAAAAATPGPWERVAGFNNELHQKAGPLLHTSPNNLDYLASVDPQTITAIVTELLALRSSPAVDGVGEPVRTKWRDIGYLMSIIDAAIEDGFDPDEDGPILDDIRAEVAAGLHAVPTSDRASVVEVDNQFAEYEGVTAKELAETVARYGKSLRSMQEAAGLAIEALPVEQQDGTVGDFLASIHRHCASALSRGHGGDFEAAALFPRSS